MCFAPVRILAAATLLAAVAGCSSSGPVASSYVANAEVASLDAGGTQPVRGVDTSLTMAQMPEPGGTISGMRERSYGNGIRQDIVLAGDKSGFGENVLSIAVQTAPTTTGGRNAVPVYRPSESGIKGEILARYPKLDMQILTQPRRNVLGTFGLAIGRHASGVRCVFGWQWIDDIRNPGAASSTFGKLGGFGSSGQPALIRINMCRKDATVDDLAMAIEGLTLAPQSVLDRALDPGRITGPVAATRAVGSGGLVVASSDGSLEGALTTAVKPQRAVASAPARTRVARAKSRKPAAAIAEESTVPQSPVAPVYQSGPRYLAPIAGAPVGASSTTAYNTQTYATPVSPYGGTAAPVSKSLDPSLPAAAYRGPTSGATR